jgi:hypothetical protein
MKTVLHSYHYGVINASIMSIKAREFDRRLIRLGAGIAEERGIHTRDRAQSLPKLCLDVDCEQIGGVHEHSGLLANGLRHRRIGMTQPADGNTRQRIEIAPALSVPQPHALPTHERHWLSRVSCH